VVSENEHAPCPRSLRDEHAARTSSGDNGHVLHVVERDYLRAAPFQDDHIFVSANLQQRVHSCSVLDYEPFGGVSDHAPMVLEIDL
jgi:endonuclease/exonuclease/phosphatase family metal-dependent hydrolase